MTDVYVTTYEVQSGGRHLAYEHYAEVKRIRDTHLKLMTELGGLAYRPDHNGFMGSIFFDAEEKPRDGYRGTGGKEFRNQVWLEERVPRKSTSVGKFILNRMQALEPLPSHFDLTKKFGWTIPHAYSDNRVYRPTVMRLELPAIRDFLRLPRQFGDGWQGHHWLKAIPEAVLMVAAGKHNELVPKHLEEAA